MPMMKKYWERNSIICNFCRDMPPACPLTGMPHTIEDMPLVFIEDMPLVFIEDMPLACPYGIDHCASSPDY